jgi:hypothetical protein
MQQSSIRGLSRAEDGLSLCKLRLAGVVHYVFNGDFFIVNTTSIGDCRKWRDAADQVSRPSDVSGALTL